EHEAAGGALDDQSLGIWIAGHRMHVLELHVVETAVVAGPKRRPKAPSGQVEDAAAPQALGEVERLLKAEGRRCAAVLLHAHAERCGQRRRRYGKRISPGRRIAGLPCRVHRASSYRLRARNTASRWP